MRGGVLPLTLARLPGACGSPAGAALPAPLGRAAGPALPAAAPPAFAPALPSERAFIPTRVGLPLPGSTSITLERWIDPSRSMIPPCRIFWVGFWCFLIRFKRSTTTRPFSGITRNTLPFLPRSLPATTITVSPFRTCAIAIERPLDDFGSERDDLGELLVPQLARHRPENTGAHRVVVRLEEDHRVAVEADVGPVAASHFLHGTHHHRPRDLALLHGPVRHRLLDRHHHHVAQGGVALVGAAHDPDALDLLGPRVVGHVQHGARLDHDALASTWRMRHRFSFDSGRVSSISTRSPTLLAFFSSCALRRFDRVITRSYFG